MNGVVEARKGLGAEGLVRIQLHHSLLYTGLV